jgi:hypothetical protein
MRKCGFNNLDLGTSLRWAVSFTSWPPYPHGKSPTRYKLDRRLCGPQRRSGRCGEHKISCSDRESNLSRPARSLSLYRLSHFNSTMSGCLELSMKLLTIYTISWGGSVAPLLQQVVGCVTDWYLEDSFQFVKIKRLYWYCRRERQAVEKFQICEYVVYSISV